MYSTLGLLKKGAGGGGSSGGGSYPVIVSNTLNEDTSAPFNAIMPATVDVGDLLIIMLVVGTSGTPNATPSGWTQLVSGNFHGFYKWADGTEDGSSVTVGFAGAADPGFTVLRIQGADTGQNPQAVIIESGVDTTSPNPPAIDPSWADTKNLIIAYVGTSTSSSTLVSYPAGFTVHQQANTSGANTSSFVSAKQVSTSALIDPGLYSLSLTPFYRAITIAVKGA